ncbi:MAG: GTP-binding protein, partial [Candidatus Hermodarchaeota archaeon]
MKDSHIRYLLSQYVEYVKGILAVLVYKRRDSSLIEELTKPRIAEPQNHVNYTYVDDLIKDLSNEFGDDKDFLVIKELAGKKIVSCSLGINYVLITIALIETSDIELKIYSTHIANELERIEEDTTLEDLTFEVPGILKMFSKIKNAKISTNKLSLKIIVVGDYQVGKTSLINAFTDKKFRVNLKSTVGFNVYKKILNIDDEIVMNLAIWDTGGLSSQISPTKEKIFNFSDAVIIVVDKTHQNILKCVEKWYNEIKHSLNQKIPILVAITKNDMDEDIDLGQIKDYLTKYRMDCLLVSAKNRENVDELFFELIYTIISLKTEKNHNEVIEDTEKYKGNYLTSEEITALKDLENLLIENLNIQGGYIKRLAEVVEESGIPIVYEIDHTSFGVRIEDGHVVGLGLFNCYLKTLPKSILSLKYVKKINLRCNQLSLLPEIIFNIESLEWLDAALTDLKTLSESIGNLSNLQFLYLENNSLITLPRSIGNLKDLKELHLENNPVKILPDEIGYLHSLEKLFLEAPSYFYKGGLKELPYTVGDLVFLQVLDLSSCELKYLPESFGNLKALKILDLYDNNIDFLPETFGNLKMLEILNLDYNNLIFLPDSIGDLIHLKQIHISNNPLRKKASEKFKALALKSK